MSELEQQKADAANPIDEPGQLPPQGFVQPAVALQLATHEGPLPHPATLQAYEELCPGAADRIFRMTEREQEHRIACERESLSANVLDAEAERSAEKRGQWQAFIVCMTAILSGVGLAFLGTPLGGVVLSGGTMIGVAAVFITRKRNAE